MPATTLDSMLFGALFCALMAMLLGVLATWVWALRRLWLGIPLLEDMKPVPPREVPWGGAALAMTVLLYLLVSVTVVRVYASLSGKPVVPPAKVVQEPVPPAPDAKGRTEKPEAAKAGPDGKAGPKRPGQSQGDLMLQSAIINLMLLVLVPPFVMAVSRATSSDLGWDGRDWPRQVFQGARAGMLVTPVVFAIQSMAVRIWPPQKHPLEEMVLERFSPAVAILAVVSAMILAPCVEELLFRGLLQQWLTKLFLNRAARGLAAHGPLSDAGLDGSRDEVDPDLLEQSPWDVRDDFPDDHEPESMAVLGSLVITAGLFAGMHYLQWPAPIAIFLLALWLGAVYQRSGSLLTAVSLHGTFNGFSTLMLLLEALSRKFAANPAVAGSWEFPLILRQVLDLL